MSDDTHKRLMGMLQSIEGALVARVHPSVLHLVEEELGTFPLGEFPPGQVQPEPTGLQAVELVAQEVERGVSQSLVLLAVESDERVISARAEVERVVDAVCAGELRQTLLDAEDVVRTSGIDSEEARRARNSAARAVVQNVRVREAIARVGAAAREAVERR
jgi:hypothetical protein